MANSNFGGVQISDGYATPQQLLPNGVILLHFFSAGNQTVGTKKNGAIVPVTGTIVDVRAYADTAPTGSALIFDVNKNGSTVFTTTANRPRINGNQNVSTTFLPDVTAVAVGDRLTYDVVQVGATTAGADVYLSVAIKTANQA